MTGPLNLKRNRGTPPVERPWDDPRLDEGIGIYNEGHHWHAHECWEPLWMGLEGDDKLFVQGLIMSAAMLHQYGRKVPRGVHNHWANVTLRLNDPFGTQKFRVSAGDDRVLQITERNFGARMVWLAFNYSYGRPPRVRQATQEQQAPAGGFAPPGA